MKKSIFWLFVLASFTFAQSKDEGENEKIKLAKLKVCEVTWLKTQVARCATITGFVPKNNIVVIPKQPINLFDDQTASINGGSARKIAVTKPDKKKNDPGFVAYWVPNLKCLEEFSHQEEGENLGGMADILIPNNEEETEHISVVFNKEEAMAWIPRQPNRNLWNLLFGAPLTLAANKTKSVIGIVYKLGMRKKTSTGGDEVIIAYVAPVEALEAFLHNEKLVKTVNKDRTSVLKAERIPGTWVEFYPPNITEREKNKILKSLERQ